MKLREYIIHKRHVAGQGVEKMPKYTTSARHAAFRHFEVWFCKEFNLKPL